MRTIEKCKVELLLDLYRKYWHEDSAEGCSTSIQPVVEKAWEIAQESNLDPLLVSEVCSMVTKHRKSNAACYEIFKSLGVEVVETECDCEQLRIKFPE